MQQTSLRIELALPKQRICALIQHMFHSGENILSCCLVALKAYAKNFYKFEKFIQALYLSSKHDHLFFLQKWPVESWTSTRQPWTNLSSWLGLVEQRLRL